VEEASDGVTITQDEKIVFANGKAAEIFGYSRNELMGLAVVKLIDEKYYPLVKERYEKRLQGMIVPSTYEIEMVTKTGQRVPVELGSTRINYQGRSAVLVILRDIKDRKRVEEERLKLEKLTAVVELATMVGHDLRNPLQSIENAIYYLKTELPCLLASEKGKDMLRVIDNSVNYADKIVRDLHAFSAEKAPALKQTDVNMLVEETLSQIQTLGNVELRTELRELPQVMVDKDQIERVLMNLTLNGIQAMENGGTLTVSTKKAKGFVEISFTDTGVGIPEENMEKIFSPFFTTKARGMGMGLAICKKFVGDNGGTIQVKSEVGKGTTVVVKLPLTQETRGEKQ